MKTFKNIMMVVILTVAIGCVLYTMVMFNKTIGYTPELGYYNIMHWGVTPDGYYNCHSVYKQISRGDRVFLRRYEVVRCWIDPDDYEYLQVDDSVGE